MLLSPERGLALNASAAAIVTRCTGQYSTAEIIDSLARDSTAPRATIEHEVRAFLDELWARSLIRDARDDG